jgi:hypothetical protein
MDPLEGGSTARIDRPKAAAQYAVSITYLTHLTHHPSGEFGNTSDNRLSIHSKLCLGAPAVQEQYGSKLIASGGVNS